MKRVKIVAGLLWAFIGLIVIIILFPGLNSFSSSLSRAPFMKLNPRYTGGAVSKQLISERCTLDVRVPVFNGFLKERNTGFVQLDWRGTLPDKICDSIDYDEDGVKDFCIAIDRAEMKTTFEPYNVQAKNIIISTPTSYGWAVRIGLLKVPKSKLP